ncbi:porin family protein [Aquimarina algiphila]|uniref:porin family protein n=1 Tax=Aquimarina algiphila TaxID=2047982 RepID=UPI00232F7C64|nr:porin family protein [Aquimarina algiphila]
MKKLMLFAVLASLSLVATAQEESIRFGAKAGVNFANISGDGTDGVDGRTGFHIGALVEIPISEKFAFQPELLYSSQGAKLDIGNLETTTKINYINIPLMAKYYVAQGFSLQAGPQIGFLTSAKAKVEGPGVDEDNDIDDAIKGIDFGLNFGLGYQLDMGLFFDGRYNLGLSNINDTESSDDVKQKNSVIQLSVGYKF